jgi:AcrR family transcriptional regulator
VIRIVPRQARAERTVQQLENAIRALLRDPEVGRYRFSAQQVAVLAGVSIGTVYRYFPSRVEMLEHVWPERRDTYLPKNEPENSATAE